MLKGRQYKYCKKIITIPSTIWGRILAICERLLVRFPLPVADIPVWCINGVAAVIVAVDPAEPMDPTVPVDPTDLTDPKLDGLTVVELPELLHERIM